MITEVSHAQNTSKKAGDLGDDRQLWCTTQSEWGVFTWALRGIANGFDSPEIYCQSKQMERRPKPSLPLEPPNIRVKFVDL